MSSPWSVYLPTSVEVGGKEYHIRSDYRAILDICVALNDPDLDDTDRALVVLDIFYVDFTQIPQECYQEAIQKCFWFINCGNEDDSHRNAPKLVDWEQDFRHIVSPINRVMGKEIRSEECLHWWTFISAYFEIGDCLFAQIIRIREQLANGKPLDKSDRTWYERNRDLVDLKTTYTNAENDILKRWM